MLSRPLWTWRLAAALVALQVGLAHAEPGKIDVEASEIATELVGRPVYAMDGQEVGTVADLLLDEAGLPQRLRMTAGKQLGLGGRTVDVFGDAFMVLRGAVVLDFPAADVAQLPDASDADEDH